MQKTKYFLLEPVNGLCNRLRALASGIILSRTLNRKLLVDWKCDKDIGFTHFLDLFETTDWIVTNDNRELFESLKHDSKIFISSSRKNEMDLIDDICNTTNDVIYLKNSGGNFWEKNTTISDFIRQKSTIYNSFIPKPFIVDKINDFAFDKNIYECIGVHIRRGDRANITPSTETFAMLLNNELYRCTNNIYLSTDCPNEHIKLVEELDHYIKRKSINGFDKKINIIQYPKTEFSRNNKNNIIEALIEWYLLGMCKCVIYSQASSFGYEACIRTLNTNSKEARKELKKTDNEKRNSPSILTIIENFKLDY